MAMNKRTRVASESIGFLIILAGILVAANVLSVFTYARADLTAAQVFTLADGSKNVVRELDDRMEVTMYFTEDLPPPFNATERYVRDLLEEYEAASGGNMVLEVVHPDTEEEKKAAREDGAQLVEHRAVQNDEVSIQKGYRSVVIGYLGNQEVLTVGRDTSGLEYQITMAMKKLAGDKRPVGIVKGHETPSLSEQLSRFQDALPLYELEEVSLDGKISQDLAALLLIDPGAKLKTEELKRLDQYVMNGGALGVFGGGFKVTIPKRRRRQRPKPLSGKNVETNVNRLLSKWGVRVRQGMVADQQCGRAPMRGTMGLQIAVPYPPVPVLTLDEEQQRHPTLFRVRKARVPFSAPLEVTGAPGGEVEVKTLARSSKNSWLMEGDDIRLKPRRPEEWQPTAKSGPFPLLASIQGKLPSAFASQNMSSSEESGKGPLGPKRAKKETRVFVAGSGMFLHNSFIPRQQQRNRQRSRMTGTLALALNSVDWLAQEEDLIAIRAKDVEDPPLEVPHAVGQAEKNAKQAAKQAQQAMQKGKRRKAQEAIEKREQALERRKSAKAAWEWKKTAYQWGNALGIPVAFALFGVVRWRLRLNKKKNIEL